MANRAILGSDQIFVDIPGKRVVRGMIINLRFSSGEVTVSHEKF